jgi:hypothetical protein
MGAQVPLALFLTRKSTASFGPSRLEPRCENATASRANRKHRRRGPRKHKVGPVVEANRMQSRSETYMFSQQTHSVGFNLRAFEKYSCACALRLAALAPPPPPPPPTYRYHQ